MSYFQKLADYVKKRFYRWRYSKYKPIFCDDEPENIQPGHCYIVTDDGYPYSVLFKCPCGCNDDIALNLVGQHPVWKLKSFNADDQITLHPSVHRINRCKSHFFVRGGCIVWV